MSKRDLIRNMIIIGILGLVLITLRLFVFQPLWVSDQMANASVKKDDLVLATKKGKIDRTDLVLYHVKEMCIRDSEEKVLKADGIIRNEFDSFSSRGIRFFNDLNDIHFYICKRQVLVVFVSLKSIKQ